MRENGIWRLESLEVDYRCLFTPKLQIIVEGGIGLSALSLLATNP